VFQILLVSLFVFLFAMIVAIKFLPWWGIILLFVALIVSAKFIGRWLFKRLVLTPFRMKGAVLKDADVQIHSIVPAEPPVESDPEKDENSQNDEGEEPESYSKVPCRYWALDVTITPKPSDGKFQLWEPTELRLSRVGSPVEDDDDDGVVISKCEVEEEGEFRSDDLGKYHGARRLRLLVGVPENIREFQFRYYFEALGKVNVP
jgi:hypothetical protein